MGEAKMENYMIRLAQTEDTTRLTEIALSAKASWGYSESFMAACEVELTVTPDMLATHKVWVGQIGDIIGGMIALGPRQTGGISQLEHFFVEPHFQKRGIGRSLFETLIAECRAQAVTRLELDADPYAEPIYQRLGFSTIGKVASKSIPERVLPRMALVLVQTQLTM
jgi:GNAT superfamily N-acetyltransferase